MCSINRQGDCVNKFCSCPMRHVLNSTNKKWLIYEVEDRTCWNRIIGWFINLIRKPSVYPKPLTKEQRRKRAEGYEEMRRRYGLLDDDTDIDEPTKQEINPEQSSN